MNSLVIILIAVVVLGAGYLGYGRWLAKKWGVDPNAKTPAVANEDGSLTIPYTKVNQTIVIELPEVMDLNQYKGVSITGVASEQLSLEFYGADFDKNKDNWWQLPTDSNPGFNCWTWWPFYLGSWSNRVNDKKNYDSVDDYMKAHPDAEIKIACLDPESTKVGIPMKKGDETKTLLEAVNKALGELAEDGTLTELSEKYFGTDIAKEAE